MSSRNVRDDRGVQLSAPLWVTVLCTSGSEGGGSFGELWGDGERERVDGEGTHGGIEKKGRVEMMGGVGVDDGGKGRFLLIY